MDLNQARFNMIEQQIRPWEVLDPQVLELLSVVHREDFVPLAHKALAFVDMEIPLGAAPNQVMLAPRVQARLLQDLAVKKTDKVLDIGTGSGFMAALLAHQGAQRKPRPTCKKPASPTSPCAMPMAARAQPQRARLM
jgi:protein-L-isoaspartate(D-aspartate) O-methyltransferase